MRAHGQNGESRENDMMRRRAIYFIVLAALAGASFYLDRSGRWPVAMREAHSLWEFLAIGFGILAAYQAFAALTRWIVAHRKGPEGEARMLTDFLWVCSWVFILASVFYSLGVLRAVGAVAAGFAGMLLGWSLQAPVSGVAAWALVTLKRPFRVGDRVLFPTLGLNGDVKRVGLMYTVLDQVGGAIGSEEAIGRDILIPNAMLFQQVAINYTPRATAAYFLDEVVLRLTYDSDWDTGERIMLDAAREVTADIIEETGQEPYIRSDIWDYGILMRLRYMTKAKDRPRITHEIVKRIFKEVQRNPRVDVAIPFVYSFRKSTAVMRDRMPEPEGVMQEISVEQILDAGPLDPEDAAEADALAERIAAEGLLQPIIVAPLPDGRYRILAGEQRFRACRRLGWKSIPVLIQAAPEK